MAIYTKVGGSPKEVMDVKVKVDGVWKQAASIHKKINGSWKEVWVGDYIALNVYHETTSQISKDVHYKKLDYDIKKLTFKNIHIVAYDSNGAIIAEYIGTEESVADFSISLRNSSGGEVGYVTVHYYYVDEMIRYIVSCDGDYGRAAKVTLNIGSIVPSK